MAKAPVKDENVAESNGNTDGKKRQHDEVPKSSAGINDGEEPQTKKTKSHRATRSAGRKTTSIDKAKLDKIMSAYGVLPLQDTAVVNPTKSEPETILAMVYLAMLTSARISHQLAYKSLQCLVEAGYHNLQSLKQSSWEERTEVLTKGGYTRYREKTATALGQLAEFIDQKYGMKPHSISIRPSPARYQRLPFTHDFLSLMHVRPIPGKTAI